MAATTKTVVATGASSGLGFHVIKHLLSQTSQPYNFILGARDVTRTQDAYRSAFPGASLDPHSLEILPLELADLQTVKQFAKQTLEKLEGKRIDYLLLNAGITNGAGTEKPGPGGSKWCEALVVNHLSQHYLTHLLLPALVRPGSDGADTAADSNSRIVVVSSGAIRRVTDPSTLEKDLLAGSGKDGNTVYAETKFVQLLGAHWWRRKLKETACKVVAVSPGLIPGTGIGRGSGLVLSMEMKDAKSVDEGAQSIMRAFTRDDFPEDPDRIFLTSWGEWWDSETLGKTLDKEVQDRWCPEKGEIETEEGLKDL